MPWGASHCLRETGAQVTAGQQGPKESAQDGVQRGRAKFTLCM